MALRFIQAQPFKLSGAGSSIGDTTIVLQSMVGIDGSNIVTADIGSVGEGTLEPGNGTQEEAIQFTGITQNANGTATLTGVSTVLFKYPYTATSGLAKTHAGASTFILSNTAAFYNQFAAGSAMTTGTYDPALIAEQLVGLTAAQSLSNKTLTAPILTSPTLGVATATSLQVPILTAASGIAISVVAGSYNTIQTYTPGAGGTATLDLSKGNIHHITMPAGNITIALANQNTGQCFVIRILQDSGGSRTVTWFTTIKWPGAVVPTLTTTASKADTFGFEITGSSTYDAFVVGQNL